MSIERMGSGVYRCPKCEGFGQVFDDMPDGYIVRCSSCSGSGILDWVQYTKHKRKVGALL